jgi:hypothetical protein
VTTCPLFSFLVSLIFTLLPNHLPI